MKGDEAEEQRARQRAASTEGPWFQGARGPWRATPAPADAHETPEAPRGEARCEEAAASPPACKLCFSIVGRDLVRRRCRASKPHHAVVPVLAPATALAPPAAPARHATLIIRRSLQRDTRQGSPTLTALAAPPPPPPPRAARAPCTRARRMLAHGRRADERVAGALGH